MTEYAVNIPEPFDAFKGEQKKPGFMQTLSETILPALLAGSVTSGEGDGFFKGFNLQMLKNIIDRKKERQSDEDRSQEWRYKIMTDPQILALYQKAKERMQTPGQPNETLDQALADVAGEGGSMGDYGNLYRMLAGVALEDPIAIKQLDLYNKILQDKSIAFGAGSTRFHRKPRYDKDGNFIGYADDYSIAAPGGKEGEIGKRLKTTTGSVNETESGWKKTIGESLGGIIPTVSSDSYQSEQEKKSDQEYLDFLQRGKYTKPK